MIQREKILHRLRTTGRISPLTALNELGCYRLAARVKELRDMGHDIETVQHWNGSRHTTQYIMRVGA